MERAAKSTTELIESVNALLHERCAPSCRCHIEDIRPKLSKTPSAGNWEVLLFFGPIECQARVGKVIAEAQEKFSLKVIPE